MSFASKLDKLMLIEYGAGLMYYIEKHKLLEIISRLLAEIVNSPADNPRKWLGNNILRIARDIYTESLESFHREEPGTFYQMPKNFLLRVVIFGKPGSGRHTLADALVKRFNLVLIDVDLLLYYKINSKQDHQAKQLQEALKLDSVYAKSQAATSVVHQRLLREDALSHGWVLINFPNNKCEALELFETFAVPPNRFVYLKCPEQMARARIVTKPFQTSPQNSFIYIERQMQQYRKSKRDLNDYLATRREVIYVDATLCFEEVKIHLLTELSRTPYILGFKYGMSS